MLKFGSNSIKSLKIGNTHIYRVYYGQSKVFENLEHKLGRGIAFVNNVSINFSITNNINWCYNWASNTTQQNMSSMLAKNIAFAPQIWGGTFNKETIKNYIKSNQSIRYLLAFNEPSMGGQSWLTPRECATLWPQLEEIANECSVQLVSPAMCFSGSNMEEDGINLNNPIDWLDKFFADYSVMYGREARVDYIACHIYVNNINDLMSQIHMYEKYGRKIWLTEFNYCDWNSPTPNGTMQDQINFMREALPRLDSDNLVFAYSWFFSNAKDNVYSLIDNNGNTTDLGTVYFS